jgi:16S rRNA (uracil1498-N3)-methyltransferase
VSLVPYVHLDGPLDGVGVADRVPLTAAESHRLGRVLRLRPGADVEVADGTGWHATGTYDRDTVRLTSDPLRAPVPTPRLVLAQALPKGRKLDEVVRVATELGADRIVPVLAERSVSRPDDRKADRAVERWRAVARAACEQARRPHRPMLDAPVPTAGLPQRLDPGPVLVAVPGAAPLPRVVAAIGPLDAVTLVVGPEGGLTPAEVDGLVAAGGRAVGLGPTVLRTEHAGAAGLAALAAGVGRWG